jgi:hypothetical protein
VALHAIGSNIYSIYGPGAEAEAGGA